MKYSETLHCYGVMRINWPDMRSYGNRLNVTGKVAQMPTEDGKVPDAENARFRRRIHSWRISFVRSQSIYLLYSSKRKEEGSDVRICTLKIDQLEDLSFKNFDFKSYPGLLFQQNLIYSIFGRQWKKNITETSYAVLPSNIRIFLPFPMTTKKKNVVITNVCTEICIVRIKLHEHTAHEWELSWS